MRRLLLSTLPMLLAGSACALAEPPAAPEPASERVFYELVVTAPGSRSQGVRGQLFDAKGLPQSDVPTLEPVQTPLGPFDRIGCQYLWSTCGDLRRVEGFVRDGPGNDPMQDGPTLFRVTRIEGPGGVRYRGDLFDGSKPVPLAARVETPMGPYVRLDGKFAGQDWSGWIPEYWLPEKAR